MECLSRLCTVSPYWLAKITALQLPLLSPYDIKSVFFVCDWCDWCWNYLFPTPFKAVPFLPWLWELLDEIQSRGKKVTSDRSRLYKLKQRFHPHASVSHHHCNHHWTRTHWTTTTRTKDKPRISKPTTTKHGLLFLAQPNRTVHRQQALQNLVSLDRHVHARRGGSNQRRSH